MLPSAELVLAPKVDPRALRRSSKRAQDAMARAGRQAAKSIKKDLKRGIEDGFKDGSSNGAKAFKKGMAALGVAGLLAKWVELAVGGADQVGARIREKALMMQEMKSTADAFGIDAGRYAGLNIASQGLGINPDDIRGMLSGFSAELNEPEMQKYKELADSSGLDVAFLNLLKKAAEMSPTEGQRFLNPILGDEDSVYAGKITAKIREMNEQGIDVTFQSLLDHMATFNIQLEELKKGLEGSREAINALNQDAASSLQDSIIKGLSEKNASLEVERVKSERKVLQAELENFATKVRTALTLDKGKIGLIKVGGENAQRIYDFIDSVDELIKNFSLENLGKTFGALPGVKYTEDLLKYIKGIHDKITMFDDTNDDTSEATSSWADNIGAALIQTMHMSPLGVIR